MTEQLRSARCGVPIPFSFFDDEEPRARNFWPFHLQFLAICVLPIFATEQAAEDEEILTQSLRNWG
jgi:hypothetical protein